MMKIAFFLSAVAPRRWQRKNGRVVHFVPVKSGLKKAGFTLIEVLVVLLIISIVSTVSLLGIRYNQNKAMESFTNELLELLTLAQEQAILQPVVLGVSLAPDAIQFLDYVSDGKKMRWIERSDTLLGRHAIPSGMTLRMESEQKGPNGWPMIIFATNGDVTPFIFYIGNKNGEMRYTIQGKVNGDLTAVALH